MKVNTYLQIQYIHIGHPVMKKKFAIIPSSGIGVCFELSAEFDINIEKMHETKLEQGE